jgi:hypothetical protein
VWYTLLAPSPAAILLYPQAQREPPYPKQRSSCGFLRHSEDRRDVGQPPSRAMMSTVPFS